MPRVAVPLLSKTVKFGETVDLRTLQEKSLLLSLDIRKSALGKLVKLFYKVPDIFLEILTLEGTNLSYRIIPSMARADFLINPLILNEQDWFKWHLGEPIKHIAAFRVTLKPQWTLDVQTLQSLFDSDIAVSISENQISPQTVAMTKNALYPTFFSVPYFTTPELEEKFENGQQVFQLHAPGEMRFHLSSAGKHTLLCEFGIASGAYDTTHNPFPTDGAEFSIALLEQGQETLLFKRLLRPLQVVEDRGVQKCEVDFEVHIPADLVLRTHPGPANVTHSDWSFWKTVQVIKK